MLDELQRITCDANIVESARQAWKEYVPKIIKQARMERGTRVVQAVSLLLDDEKGILKIYFCSVLLLNVI